MTYGELPPPPQGTTLPGGGYLEPRRPCLYCTSCGESSSANPGDYWHVPKDQEIRCVGCDEPMYLALQREVTVPWSAKEELSRFIQAAWNAAP